MHPDTGMLFSSSPEVLKSRMMVAEFVTRGQSGSPINGEIPSLNSNMPGSQGRELSGNPPAGYIREDIVLGPVSPGGSSADGFPSNASNFELAAHIKRKELFSQRKQREFIPDNKKDDNYWDRRRRNNEAAKRSREKRRFNDMVLERRVVELTKENHVLKAQLEAIKEEYGICGENIVCVEKIMASLPTSEQVLSITKRPKLSSSSSPGALLFQTSPSPIPTPVIHQPVSHPVIGSSPPPTVGHGMHLHHPHATETYQHPHPHSHHDTDTYHRGPPYYQPFSSQYEHSSPILVSNNNNDALNLCSRSRARSRSHSSSRVHSPFEVSSGNGSGDESCVPLPLTLAPTQQTSTPAAAQDSNNSLPLKLRHKSHLGDKDAASALLSLQNIKQEPGPRASPPWDEGSSDERDSGISLGSEWPASSAAAVAAVAAIALHKQSHPEDVDSENKHRLHSEIVRLSTEVANLKSLVIRNKTAVKQSPPQH